MQHLTLDIWLSKKYISSLINAFSVLELPSPFCGHHACLWAQHKTHIYCYIKTRARSDIAHSLFNVLHTQILTSFYIFHTCRAHSGKRILVCSHENVILREAADNK